MTRAGWLAVVGSAALGVTALASWVLRGYTRYEIADRSMEPALLPGDYVIVKRRLSTLDRGDIVVFPHPLRADIDLVKRVVGLPGEAVDISDGHVVIDGIALDEPWTVEATTADDSWRLADCEIFVLGDARALSSGDSRTIGPVATNGLHGVASCVYWPLRRRRRLAR